MRLILTLLLTGIASAAGAQLPMSVSGSDIASSIRAAQGEVLLSAPIITSVEVQAALREVSVTRGVEIFVLVDLASAWAEDSYAPSLVLSGNVAVHLSQHTIPSALIIDRELVIEGPLVSQAAGVLSAPTYAYKDAAVALERVRTFNALWQQGEPLAVDKDSIQTLLENP